MKDLNYRDKKLVKLDKEIHNTIKRLKREMEIIEDEDLSLGEIVSRPFRSLEIMERLKLGSIERRRLKK